MSDDCTTVRMSLGVYVLGALEPVERAVTEAHLAGCQACRDELVHLAGLPGLLGRLSLVEVTGGLDPAPAADTSHGADVSHRADVSPGVDVSHGVDVSPGVDVSRGVDVSYGADVRLGPNVGRTSAVERAVAELGRRRRSARRRLVAVAAALVVAVAGVSAGVTAAATASGDAPSGRMLTATGSDTRVHATVWVADESTGSALTVQLRGVYPGEHCVLVAVGTDGRREIAASWVANYDGDVDVRGASGISADRLARLLVVNESGEEVVALPLAATPS